MYEDLKAFPNTDKQQPENVKYFKYFGSVITNDVRCTREIKSRTVMEKSAFKSKMKLFTRKLDLNLREAPFGAFFWQGVDNQDTSESRLETPGRFEMWCWRNMDKIRTNRDRNEAFFFFL